MNKAGSTYTILGSIAFLASMGITQWGNAENPKVEWYWTPPTTGSQVVEYYGEMRLITSLNDTVFYFVPNIAAPVDSLPRYSMDYQWGTELSFRVAGRDSGGRQGPYSLWSEPWLDDGAPGGPGTPSRYLRME